jgi:excisionase family DNA binding protein
MATQTQLLSLEEVAFRLGVTVDRIRQWCEAGRLRAERSSDGCLRFRADAVLKSLRPAPPDMSRLLTVEQAAIVMRSCPALVESLVADGVLAVRLLPDDELRLRREDVDRLSMGPGPAPCIQCGRRCGGSPDDANAKVSDAPAEGITWSGFAIVECWVDCAAMWRGK